MGSSKADGIRQFFHSLDKNGDGTLSREEISDLFGHLYTGISNSEVDRVLEAVDVDRSGSVDIDEFVNWVFGLGAEKQVQTMAKQGHRLDALGKVAWHAKVPVPDCYSQRRATVRKTHRRAMRLQQLLDLGGFIESVLQAVDVKDPNPNPEFNVGRITWENVNLYHINDLFVMPLTEADKCSFMEMVATKPQDPLWFISHWWGTSFKDSLAMLRFHAKTRKLKKSSSYWMCTFANNQHCLEELSQNDLYQTPFVKAIMSHGCIGTIALLTEKTAMPFRRIWCVLEDFITMKEGGTKSPRHLFDVATIIPEGEQEIDSERWVPRSTALLIDDGNGAFQDQGSDIAGDDGWFPAVVGKYGVSIDVTSADASNASDKDNILRLIGDHADEINFALRRRFAPLALYNAATTEGDAAEVKRLLGSGLLGSRNEALKAVDGGGCLAGAAEYSWGLKVVRCLLAQGANPNALDEDGLTPVILAIMRNKMKNLQALLEGKADPNRKSKKGATPVGVARKMKRSKALELLQKHGADMSTTLAKGGSSSSSSSSDSD